MADVTQIKDKTTGTTANIKDAALTTRVDKLESTWDSAGLLTGGIDASSMDFNEITTVGSYFYTGETTTSRDQYHRPAIAGGRLWVIQPTNNAWRVQIVLTRTVQLFMRQINIDKTAENWKTVLS